jgi:hypothetical protein
VPARGRGRTHGVGEDLEQLPLQRGDRLQQRGRDLLGGSSVVRGCAPVRRIAQLFVCLLVQLVCVFVCLHRPDAKKVLAAEIELALALPRSGAR